MAGKANEGSVGIKIAKPFFDVNTAGDADLILNSSWPTLQVAFEANVAPGLSNLSHSIGFPPLTLAWLLGSEISRTQTGIEVTKDSVLNVSNAHVKCYNVDLSKDLEYPFIAPPTSNTLTSPDFGIKFVKEGKDLDSKDMRDFIIHSRCQSPLILAVKTQETATHTDSGGTIEYKSPYPYLSWAFGFVRLGDTYRPVPYFYQPSGTSAVSVDAANNRYSLSWNKSQGHTGATLVVLRDPFFAGVDIEASY